MTSIPDIIIADDHDLFRDAIKSMLESEKIANVIAEASNGKLLLQLLENYAPDIILMDIDMPELNGVEASKQVSEKFPCIKIVVLTMFSDQQYYYQMIEAGVRGFVLKTSNKTELIEAIEKVFKGQSYFSNELLRKLIVKLGHKKYTEKANGIIEFSDREIDIIRFMCQGNSTQEIADKINLSVKTIENYRVKLLQKTSCKNSINLVVYAIKNNIIEI